MKLEVSFDEPLNTDWDGNELLLSDILGTEPDLVSRDLDSAVEKQMLAAAVETLPERERNIVRMRYGLGGGGEHTQKEVADMMGISQSYISRLEKRIIGKLRTKSKRCLIGLQSRLAGSVPGCPQAVGDGNHYLYVYYQHAGWPDGQMAAALAHWLPPFAAGKGCPGAPAIWRAVAARKCTMY